MVAETVQFPEAPFAFRIFPVTEHPEFTVYVIAPVPDVPEVVNVAVSLYLILFFVDASVRFC